MHTRRCPPPKCRCRVCPRAILPAHPHTTCDTSCRRRRPMDLRLRGDPRPRMRPQERPGCRKSSRSHHRANRRCQYGSLFFGKGERPIRLRRIPSCACYRCAGKGPRKGSATIHGDRQGCPADRALHQVTRLLVSHVVRTETICCGYDVSIRTGNGGASLCQVPRESKCFRSAEVPPHQ